MAYLKTIFLYSLLATLYLLSACGGGGNSSNTTTTVTTNTTNPSTTETEENTSTDSSLTNTPIETNTDSNTTNTPTQTDTNTNTTQTQKPNFIIIFTDDQGYADVGAFKQVNDIKTPHIDALVEGGVQFTSGYITAPQCVPSRAGILSGQYQTRFNLESNLDTPMATEVKTIAESLVEKGYTTGLSGKWHLHDLYQKTTTPTLFFPNNQGFQEYLFGAIGPYHASHDAVEGTTWDTRHLYDDKRFRIEVQTDAAVSFIKRNQHQPFFLYATYYGPHLPLDDIPAKYLERFPNASSALRQKGLAIMSAIDDGVGDIMSTLRTLNLEENTLVFFISDNGAPLYKENWNGSLNTPFHGEKGMLTDGGIRVPYLAYWKNQLPAGTAYHNPVMSFDATATIAALAKAEVQHYDGVNLMPHMLGEDTTAPHDYLYWRWRGQAAILTPKWKLIKLGDDERLLFDREASDHESINRALQNPDVANRLQTELERWSQTLNPPGLPTELSPQDELFYEQHYPRLIW